MFPKSIKKLISELSKLPEIGPRAATRLVLHLLNRDQSELDDLSSAIKTLKRETRLCRQCFNLADKDNDFCLICQDKKRDNSVICIVETALNISPIEKTRHYHGLYHILGGLISPGNGFGPEKLKIKELLGRLKIAQSPIVEVIFALSPTTEGDTTTLYIERLLKPLKIKTSRLARGLSIGSDLEYIDENTLTNALLGRK
ncbi:recombination mediator RecR [Patescibacteria group bacterium]|nr:recombination mediator RecR [Patescibacteria group bacterium]